MCLIEVILNFAVLSSIIYIIHIIYTEQYNCFIRVLLTIWPLVLQLLEHRVSQQSGERMSA